MIFSTIYLSDFLDHAILDNSGKEVGSVTDLLVNIGDDYPVISAVLVRDKQQERLVHWQDLRSMDRRFVFCKRLEPVPPDLPGENQLLIKRDLLDHQIVDINGRKVVRINDLKLAEIHGLPRIVAVDVGLSGLLRRLGVERLVTSLLRKIRVQLKDELIVWDHVERIETGQTRVKLAVPYRKLSTLHPADLADIIEELGNAERRSVLTGLDVEVAAEAFQEIEPEVQAEILDNIDGEKASEILEAMPADEAAEILGELEEEQAEKLLSLMEEEDAAEVREILEYEEESAGRLMTTEYLSFNQSLTTEQTIVRLRELGPDSEGIFYLYVVDDEERLLGVVSLRDLVVSKPDTPLQSIMNPEVISVRDNVPHHEVTAVITKYDLLAVPVINEDRKLVGMVVINDAIDAMLLPKWKRKFERRTG